jgi:MYXO-CTERM domain-containing protein
LGADGHGRDHGRRRRRSDGDSGQISGLVDQTISSITPNPDFSGPAYSPDGSFIYNNLYHPSGMAFDIDGVLFATAQNPGGYWNLWGNSPGNYSLWESSSPYSYPIEESGSLTVTGVPELSTWAMLGLGFAGLRRRSRPGVASGRGEARLGRAYPETVSARTD